MKQFSVKILFVAVISLLTLLPSQAAGGKGELLIGGNGGVSLFSLGNKTTLGTSQLGLNYGFGLEYNANLFSNRKFGLGLVIGVKYRSLSGTVTLDNFSQDKALNKEIDGAIIRNNFEFYADIKGYKSTNTLSYLQFPVYFREMFYISRGCAWFLEEGVNLGYGLKGRTENTIDQLRTRGYFPEANVSIDDIKFRGFGSWNNISFSNESKLNFAADAHLETGVKVHFAGFGVIYIGIYADYALLQSYKEVSSGDFGGDLVQYQTDKPGEFKYAPSLYKSKYGDSRLHPLSFGLSLRLGLNFDRMSLGNGRPMYEDRH
ncbi:MAG: hypothetical protein LBQ31_06785 [Bacteroidales bacterium]|jgi:hypothetical protein|nr:hypothetical protein [Bacteroidales bacterium]